MSFITLYLPRKTLSRFVGFLAQIRWPGALNLWVIKGFAKLYSINISEAEKKIDEYSTLMEFFTRKLKPEARPIEDAFLVHPCDSEIIQRGPIESETLIQAKGLKYKVQMLTNDPEAIDKYNNGYFLTYYLCPRDYHRVHSCVSGVITQMNYSEGDLWPVNKWSVNNIRNLYTKNERVHLEIATEKGPIGVVFVGATNVGSIALNFEPSLRTNQNRGPLRKTYTPPLEVEKGQELGMFRFGSTVILLLSEEWKNQLLKSQAQEKGRQPIVKVGQALIK